MCRSSRVCSFLSSDSYNKRQAAKTQWIVSCSFPGKDTNLFLSWCPLPSLLLPPFRVILTELLIQCLLDRLHSLFKKEDHSLISYFLYLCQLGFATAPPPRGRSGRSWAFVPKGKLNMNTDNDLHFHLSRYSKSWICFFQTHIFLLYVLNQNGFFRAKQINFVGDHQIMKYHSPIKQADKNKLQNKTHIQFLTISSAVLFWHGQATVLCNVLVFNKRPGGMDGRGFTSQNQVTLVLFPTMTRAKGSPLETKWSLLAGELELTTTVLEST